MGQSVCRCHNKDAVVDSLGPVGPGYTQSLDSMRNTPCALVDAELDVSRLPVQLVLLDQDAIQGNDEVHRVSSSTRAMEPQAQNNSIHEECNTFASGSNDNAHASLEEANQLDETRTNHSLTLDYEPPETKVLNFKEATTSRVSDRCKDCNDVSKTVIGGFDEEEKKETECTTTLSGPTAEKINLNVDKGDNNNIISQKNIEEGSHNQNTDTIDGQQQQISKSFSNILASSGLKLVQTKKFSVLDVDTFQRSLVKN